MRVSTKLPLLLITTAALALTACQSRENRRQELAYVERPVEQLYNQATSEMDKRDYDQAILLFNEVERMLRCRNRNV